MLAHNSGKTVVALLLLAIAIARDSQRRKPLPLAQSIEQSAAQSVMIKNAMNIGAEYASGFIHRAFHSITGFATPLLYAKRVRFAVAQKLRRSHVDFIALDPLGGNRLTEK